MRSYSLEKVITLAVFLLYIIFFFSTIHLVPFHPDEATQIFMSHDVDLLFSNPSVLMYQPQDNLSPEQHYRLIDAPIPKTIIGIARNIFRLEPLTTDWNWSLTWEENKSNRALPSSTLLLLARISLGFFVPFGLISIFLLLKRITVWPISLLSVAFIGLNALFLVHTRRAMAEGVSLCFYFVVLIILLKWPDKAFLIGILAGLALQAKQTTLPVIFVPIIFWMINSYKRQDLSGFIKKMVFFVVSILLVYYLLNPIAWKDPFHLAILQIQNRLAFSQAQASEYMALSSPLAANSIQSKITAWLANTFFAKPAFFDFGNYAKELAPEIKAYDSIFLNQIFSGWFSGLIVIFFGLFGFIFSLFKSKFIHVLENQPLLILIIVSILQTAFSLFMLPITFQRYYLINLVLAIIWAGIGVNYLVTRLIPLK
jgi:hypothetical protein